MVATTLTPVKVALTMVAVTSTPVKVAFTMVAVTSTLVMLAWQQGNRQLFRDRAPSRVPAISSPASGI
jgi:hypothetical protein